MDMHVDGVVAVDEREGSSWFFVGRRGSCPCDLLLLPQRFSCSFVFFGVSIFDFHVSVNAGYHRETTEVGMVWFLLVLDCLGLVWFHAD